MAISKVAVKIGVRWWLNPVVRIYGALCRILTLESNADFVQRLAVCGTYIKGIK